MRKLVLIMFASLFLLSCSKDDGGEAGDVSVNEVVGKWVQTYFRSRNTNTFIGQEDGTYILFKSDGTFTFFYSGWGSSNRTTTGKYKIPGSASLPAFVQLEYGDNETGTIDISTLDNEGNATFLVNGLLFTGTYKFKKN